VTNNIQGLLMTFNDEWPSFVTKMLIKTDMLIIMVQHSNKLV